MCRRIAPRQAGSMPSRIICLIARHIARRWRGRHDDAIQRMRFLMSSCRYLPLLLPFSCTEIHFELLCHVTPKFPPGCVATRRFIQQDELFHCKQPYSLFCFKKSKCYSIIPDIKFLQCIVIFKLLLTLIFIERFLWFDNERLKIVPIFTVEANISSLHVDFQLYIIVSRLFCSESLNSTGLNMNAIESKERHFTI